VTYKYELRFLSVDNIVKNKRTFEVYFKNKLLFEVKFATDEIFQKEEKLFKEEI